MNKSRLLGTVYTAILLVLTVNANPAKAMTYEVTWSGEITDDFFGFGERTLSGTLGEFDVTSEGQLFELPADGSLSILIEGTGPGIPVGTYELTEFVTATGATGLGLQFNDILDSITANFVPIPFGTVARLASDPFSLDCEIGSIIGTCNASLFSQGEINPSRFGVAVFHENKSTSISEPVIFTVSAVPIPPAAWLFGSGLVGLIGISRRK